MDDGFSKKQLEQLTELFVAQDERFEKKLLAQDERFEKKMSDLRSAIMLDMKSLIYQELLEIKDRLDKLFEMESEDVKFLFTEVKILKIKLKKLEDRVAQMRHR